jgi:hypothetical protein
MVSDVVLVHGLWMPGLEMSPLAAMNIYWHSPASGVIFVLCVIRSAW